MMQARRYKAILEVVESFVKNALAAQVLDDSDQNYGGFRCPDHLVCEPWAAANTFTTMTVLFFNPDSQYHRSPDLFQRMKLVLQFIARSQNDDGTIDVYYTGETKTVSSIIFIINSLVKAYRLLSRETAESELSRLLESFLRKGIDAIKSKPVLTPTGRWAAASALIEFDKLFMDHSAVSKAESYLSDRIDINHDGLYSERSPACSMISNAMLLNIAKKIGKPYLIECVRRNLNFSLYNFCPDGEVVTEYSPNPRLECGVPQGYAVWKEMSIIDHNGYYASAGDLVLDLFLRNMRDGYLRHWINDPGSGLVWGGNSRLFVTSNIGELLLVEDEFNNDAINRLPLPSHYERVFPNSNIVRIRNGKMCATIMGNNNNLLALRNGRAIIDGFRIKFMYHGYRDFMPKKLEVAARSYILRDWFNPWQIESAQEKVEQVEGNLRILTEFTYKGNCLSIDVFTSGQKRVPLQLEFGIRKQGIITADGNEYDLSATDLVSVYGGDAVVKVDEDYLVIRGGVAQHRIYSSDDRWTANPHTTRLMITPLTPFSGKVQIICG